MDTMLSNPDNHKESEEEQQIYEEIKNGVIYDVEPDEIQIIEPDDAE